MKLFQRSTSAARKQRNGTTTTIRFAIRRARVIVGSESTRPAGSITLEPGDHVGGIPVRWEDRIEDTLDEAVAGDQREALVELHAGHLEGRQVERCRQLELGIAEDRVRKVDPLRELVLVLQALRRQAM